MLFIGLEKDLNGNALEQALVNRVVPQIKKEAARIFGGYSASVVSGGWLNASGDLVEEKALRLELATDDANDEVSGFAVWAGAHLSQACVLVSSVISSRSFVDSNPLAFANA